jgi:phosphoglycerate dehydrogenase-like enzyme
MVLPGGDATRHILDERRMRLMKKGAYLINDGRGNAIDPAGLKAVLKDGHLGGAGLDVTEPEPLPADDELWDMDNVIITPHIAGQFLLASTFEKIVKIAGENLHAYVTGGELRHVVNRRVGY